MGPTQIYTFAGSMGKTMAAVALLAAVQVDAVDLNMPVPPPVLARDAVGGGAGQDRQGVGIVNFITAVGVALIIFVVQVLLFALLRNKQTRI